MLPVSKSTYFCIMPAPDTFLHNFTATLTTIPLPKKRSRATSRGVISYCDPNQAGKFATWKKRSQSADFATALMAVFHLLPPPIWTQAASPGGHWAAPAEPKRAHSETAQREHREMERLANASRSGQQRIIAGQRTIGAMVISRHQMILRRPIYAIRGRQPIRGFCV